MRSQDHSTAEAMPDDEDAGGEVEIDAMMPEEGHPAATEAAFWGRSLAALKGEPPPAPPEPVVRGALALFDRRYPRPAVWPRVIATLVYDSRTHSAMAGARDAEMLPFPALLEREETGVAPKMNGEEDGWQAG